MNFRNLLTRRSLITILVCGAVAGYSGWLGSHRSADVNTNPPPNKLLQKLALNLVKLRDNIDKGISPEELKTRASAIWDSNMEIFEYNYNSIPRSTRDKLGGVVKSIHETQSAADWRAHLKDLRAKTELAIVALSSASSR